MNTLTIQPSESRHALGGAFAVSVAIEVMVLSAIAAWLGHHESKLEVKPRPPVQITIAAPPAPPAPKPMPPVHAPAPPTPPKPVTPPRVQPPKQAVAKPEKVEHQLAPLPKAAAPAEQTDAPAAHPDAEPAKAPAVATPPAPPPPPASSSNAKPSAVFEAKLRDAVQAAARYPAAARMMRLTGHVRLGFLYQDGAMSNPHVVQSSGQKMLDDAALVALNSTSFPSPPEELKGHKLDLEIVVAFSPSS